MLDDFFIRAVIGGIGVALVAGPVGCFIIWRRLAYFGDTLSHSALLGVAMALLLETNVTIAVFLVSVVASLLLLVLQRRAALSSDALLGLLAHSTLAVGLVVLAFMTWVRVDLMGFPVRRHSCNEQNGSGRHLGRRCCRTGGAETYMAAPVRSHCQS